jgi:hypothetical protein
LGFVQVHTPEWVERFVQMGYPDAEPLAAGVEGAIYRLGGGTVAKVWGERHRELGLTRAFYAEVADAGLPFDTPVFLRLEYIDGAVVTFERELPGQPLQNRMTMKDGELDPAAADCLLLVLRSLAGVPATDVMRRLPVLDEDRPFWDGADDFAGALIALIERRSARFGDVLRAHVPDFDERYARLQSGLRGLDTVPSTVVHGDLYGGNVLVDDEARPMAVLDFGFLSTCGDPRFDAGVTASIVNMYGEHAIETTDALTTRFAVELAYPARALVLYQGAYAVATANAFTADGSDGHFAWATRLLTRPMMNEVLGLQGSVKARSRRYPA